MNIWAHVFPMIYFYFENNLSIQNAHQGLLRTYEIKYVWYLLVSGIIGEQIHSLVVDFNLCFAFSKPILYFISNSSSITE